MKADAEERRVASVKLCVYLPLRARACVRACVRAFVCAWVRACVCVSARGLQRERERIGPVSTCHAT